MDPISNLNSIMKTLRQRLHNQENRKSKTSEHSSSQSSEKKEKISLEELKTSIINKTKAADPDNKNPQLTAQILLESILTWEFGEELINDPQFETMRRDIQDAVTNDPSLAEQLKAFLKN